MKILLASSKYMPEYSGSGYRAHKLYKRLMEREPGRISISILTGSETENSSADYEYDGFKVTRIADKPFQALSGGILGKYQTARNFQVEFKKAMRHLYSMKGKPDLIHIFGRNHVMSAAWTFSCREKIPMLVELCNEMFTPYPYIPFPQRIWTSNRLTAKYLFVAISEKLRKLCLKNGIRDDKIWCRPNPVDESLFRPATPAEKSSLRSKHSSFSDTDTLIVYIAKFRPSKNHMMLIDTIKMLPERFKLFLAGPLVQNGPFCQEHNQLFQKIQMRVADEGLQSRVELKSGFCENVADLYRMSDIYAFPTLNEGLGTPLLENIACGIPVVANKIPDVTTVWIKDGMNGFLCDPTPSDFSSRILLAEKIDKTSVLKNSAQTIHSSSSVEIDRKYADIIAELSGAK